MTHVLETRRKLDPFGDALQQIADEATAASLVFKVRRDLSSMPLELSRSAPAMVG